MPFAYNLFTGQVLFDATLVPDEYAVAAYRCLENVKKWSWEVFFLR